MTTLALDLSKRSTGYAFWKEGMDRPAAGTWELGCELTSHGLVFARLHQHLSEVHKVSPITEIVYEKPLDPGTLGRLTSFDVPFLLIGLAAHAESWAEAMGIRRIASYPPVTWRRHFIGSMPRGTRSVALKDFVMAKCRQLGLEFSRNDAADALGVLDYSLFLSGITPPWRVAQPLGAVA